MCFCADSAAVLRRATHLGVSDSAATFVDLEAAGSSKGVGVVGGSDVVPAQHVRRLTTTLVDILRHVAASSQHAQQGSREAAGDDDEGGQGGEGAMLLPDNSSELSVDDKASLTSHGASSAGRGSSGRTSSIGSDEVSVKTALLKAAYLPQEEYKGKCVGYCMGVQGR